MPGQHQVWTPPELRPHPSPQWQQRTVGVRSSARELLERQAKAPPWDTAQA